MTPEVCKLRDAQAPMFILEDAREGAIQPDSLSSDLQPNAVDYIFFYTLTENLLIVPLVQVLPSFWLS